MLNNNNSDDNKNECKGVDDNEENIVLRNK